MSNSIFELISLQMLMGAEWIWLVLIGIIVALIVGVVKKRIKSKGYYPTDFKKEESDKKEIDSSKPIRILNERLAKGEISLEEFEELKKTLG